MNERILNLADRAAKDMPGSLNIPDEFCLRFAELIVRECADLIDNKVTITAAQTYDEVFVAWYDTKELCAKQMKEHFGVKE